MKAKEARGVRQDTPSEGIGAPSEPDQLAFDRMRPS